MARVARCTVAFLSPLHQLVGYPRVMRPRTCRRRYSSCAPWRRARRWRTTWYGGSRWTSRHWRSCLLLGVHRDGQRAVGLPERRRHERHEPTRRCQRNGPTPHTNPRAKTWLRTMLSTTSATVGVALTRDKHSGCLHDSDGYGCNGSHDAPPRPTTTHRALVAAT